MIWAIEFRSGTYLQPNRSGGPLRTAQQFESQEAANGFIDAHEWVALNGGMAKLIRVSRYLDLELAARIILRTLPPGSLSAPPSAVATLQQKLMDLCQAIWTQGWDCREEQGALAGAFGHANRYNPYRRPAEPRKCRHCGALPLLTERGRCEDCGDCQGCGNEDCSTCHDEIVAETIQGSERFPVDVAATIQVFPEKGIPNEDMVAVIHKMRDDPTPTMAYFTGPLCEQEGGIVTDGRHTCGVCTFGLGHDGRHSWEPDED